MKLVLPGMLSGKGDQPGSGDQLEVHAVLAQHPQFDRQAVVWMQKKAVKCWWKLGHPGWSIWPADSEQFIRNVVEAGDGLTAVQIQANVPITSHASATQSQSSFLPSHGEACSHLFSICNANALVEV